MSEETQKISKKKINKLLCIYIIIVLAVSQYSKIMKYMNSINIENKTIIEIYFWRMVQIMMVFKRELVCILVMLGFAIIFRNRLKLFVEKFVQIINEHTSPKLIIVVLLVFTIQSRSYIENKVKKIAQIKYLRITKYNYDFLVIGRENEVKGNHDIAKVFYKIHDDFYNNYLHDNSYGMERIIVISENEKSYKILIESFLQKYSNNIIDYDAIKSLHMAICYYPHDELDKEMFDNIINNIQGINIVYNNIVRLNASLDEKIIVMNFMTLVYNANKLVEVRKALEIINDRGRLMGKDEYNELIGNLILNINNMEKLEECFSNVLY